MRTILNRISNFFGSIGLSCVLLIFLALLTWLGTLEQVNSGLYEVQKKYFESFILFHDVGPLAIPLPGAHLVMGLLFVNLLWGGMVKLRNRGSMAGILTTHIGIALLLLAGFVKTAFSDDGHLTFFEGESASFYQSYYRTEIAIIHPTGDGGTAEYLIPQELFVDATGARPTRLISDELPFDLELRLYMPNSMPIPKGPNFEVAVPVIDGVFLRAEAYNKQVEANISGVYLTVVEKSSGARHEGILWGRAAQPLTVEVDDKAWAIDLRKERYPLPFSIELLKFTKEDYPGMTMARTFESDVIVTEGPSSRAVNIRMNEPLRDQGYVLYQSSWGPADAPAGTPLFSTLSVVRNPADQYPLYACIVIAAGLIIHFSRRLVGYIQQQMRTAQ